MKLKKTPRNILTGLGIFCFALALCTEPNNLLTALVMLGVELLGIGCLCLVRKYS